MGKEDLLKLIPKDGFIKTSDLKKKVLKKEDKVALIRKGNELFNKGKTELAKRIFITTGYTDGLIRVGNYYLKHKQPLEALKMFWIAPNTKGADRMIEKAAHILGSWLKEEEGKEAINE
jgi:hypothetical protein